MESHRILRGPAKGGGWPEKIMYTVYIIQNQETRRYYVGYTKNIKERLQHHNSKRNLSTRSDGEWVTVHTESFDNKIDAWKRERQIKKYKSGEAFKKLVAS
jgi:putative endonuclease